MLAKERFGMYFSCYLVSIFQKDISSVAACVCPLLP